MNQSTKLISPVALMVAACASAQFSGAYAPDTWTVTGAGLGPSAAEFADDGSSLAITGPDLVAGQIDVTHDVQHDGVWSFDWIFLCYSPTAGFDNAYYLINDVPVFLSTGTGSEPHNSGHVSMTVLPDDVIGWRADSTDGLFGSCTLVITNFQIPAPGVVFLLSFAGFARARR